jgi:hypothetical protein
MRGLPKNTLTGTMALLGLFALATLSAAQERSMRFRPVPPESAARFERSDRSARADLAASRAEAVADSEAAANLAGTPEVPEIPEISQPPAMPRTRSTSSDIVRFGSDVTVTHGQVVEGDVVSFGGDVEVRGHVTGNVTSVGGDLTVASTGRVDGDVVCISGTLREEDGSSVGGQRVTAPRTPGAKLFMPMLAVVGTGFKLVVHAIGMAIMLGFAWLFVKLAPSRTESALDQIRREPGAPAIIGLLLWALLIPSVIALALVIALLCITIIGIPLAAAVAVAYAAFIVLATLWGSVIGCGVLGRRLYPRLKGGEPTLLQAVLWGGVALYSLRLAGDLLHIVPLFGFVGGLLAAVHYVALVCLGTIGAGALVRGEYQRRSLQNWWHRMRPPGGPRNEVPPGGPAGPMGPSGPTGPGSSAEAIA